MLILLVQALPYTFIWEYHVVKTEASKQTNKNAATETTSLDLLDTFSLRTNLDLCTILGLHCTDVIQT